MQLRRRPPCRQPDHDVLRPPRRRLGGDVFEAMKRDSRFAGRAALLHVGGDAADLGSARCRAIRLQRSGLEEDVGVHDHHGLGPVFAQDLLMP
jgi:hypothetical protein